MTMTRKEFLGTIVKGTAVGAVLVTTVAACGGGSDPGPPDAPPSNRNCLQNGTGVNIVGNHGHVLMVSIADIQAGVDKTYDITGSAAHSHSVTITAAEFAMLAANTGVSTTSTSGASHTHSIAVSCV